MSGQHYKNHRQIVWGYYIFPGLLLIAVIIGAVVNLMNASSSNIYSASLILALAVVVLAIFFKARSFALIAQDRAIRAEESLRHFILTGKPIDSRLQLKQIIALRFADDSEFPALAEKAARETLSPDAIKKSIKYWRGDFHRV